MFFRAKIIIVCVAVAWLLPISALAKRAAPKPVAPVTYEGVQYQAPLIVDRMGFVEAIDVTSGKKLWESRIYRVWIIPVLYEEDNQWVFITNLKIQNGKLLVKNEAGKTFQVDLKTGRVGGAIFTWSLWLCAAVILLFVIYFTKTRKRKAIG